MLLLGDNLSVELKDRVADGPWEKLFENRYDSRPGVARVEFLDKTGKTLRVFERNRRDEMKIAGASTPIP